MNWRAKPIGWRQESYRHSLSRKGISTGHRKLVPERLFTVEFNMREYLARKKLQYKPTSEKYWEKFLKRKVRDRIKGGRADGKNPRDFDQKQLKMGMKHEMEHTDDPEIAREIAQDHLAEDNLYYTHLNAMERKYSALKEDSEMKRKEESE